MEISDIVKDLMAERKGILFATVETGSEEERLSRYGIADEDARRTFRELLFTTPSIEQHLTGIILSPETVHESTKEGTPFPEFLLSKKIRSGVYLDVTASPEKISAQLREYAEHGVSFSLFLADSAVSDEPITDELEKNIRALAIAAKLSRAAGIAPIIAVEVPTYGTHSAEKAEDAILETLALLTDALKAETVPIEEVIIGVSMAVSGEDCVRRADSKEIAERTVRAVSTALSEKTGGVVFLSGAIGSEEATEDLNALARLEPLPWPIAFCFSRALLEPVLVAWKGSDEEFARAQSIFETRLALLSQADAAGYAETQEELPL